VGSPASARTSSPSRLALLALLWVPPEPPWAVTFPA
jgi:hypothetical protein